MVHVRDCLSVVLLLAVVSQGAALSCWSCMSDVVAACGEPFEPQELPGPSACPTPQRESQLASLAPPPRPVCYTAVIKLNEVETHVYRACDWAGGVAGSQEGAAFCARAPQALPPHAQMLECRSCFTDGCNASPAGVPAVVPAAGLSFATPSPLLLITLVSAAATSWLRA